VSRPPTVEVSPVLPRQITVVGVGVEPTGRGQPKVIGGEQLGADLGFLSRRGFSAKPGEVMVLPGGGGRTLIAVGLGERSRRDAEAMRLAGAALARNAKAERIAFLGGSVVQDEALAQGLVEGVALGTYDFDRYRSRRSEENSQSAVRVLTLVSRRSATLLAGVSAGESVVRAVYRARDLVNEPAGSLPPSALADRAVEACEAAGVSIEVLGPDRIAEEQMGGVLGVSAGSANEPRFLVLRHAWPARSPAGGSARAGGSAKSRRPSVSPRAVALVGKGVTFDSGGLSLKTASGMETMKTDMSGAAAVISTITALAEMGVDVPVSGFVPLVENMPGGRALKPGDVIRARSGTTIEVLNTDAEGRLILADALSMALDERPAAVVDLATLTGACTIALGDRVAGLMTTEERLGDRIRKASEASGEAVWPLPLHEPYRRHLESEVADIKNVGAPGGSAGAIVAGLFLKEFTGDTPWAHLDIAGPARSSSDEGYLRKGGTGFGVRLLIALLSSWRPLS